MHLQYSTSVPFNEQKNGKVIIEDPKDKNIHVCDFVEACEVVSSINSLLDVDTRHIDVVNTDVDIICQNMMIMVYCWHNCRYP